VDDLTAFPPDDILDSIRLFDRPPFATEPAFDAYAAAHQQPPDTIKFPRRQPKK
jgi:hypothetical protein